MPYRGLMPRDTLTREQIVSAAIDLLDADMAAILTEIGRGIDKWLWFVETSQQAGS